MKRFISIILLCVLILSFCSCDSKKEPHLTKALSFASYYGITTLEEYFGKAEIIVTGTIINGNRTQISEKVKTDENSYLEKKYVIAEIKIDKVYKGELKAGDIIEIRQQYGESGYVELGYLKYKSDYLMFLYDAGDYDELLGPYCREEIIDGSFEHPMASTNFGEVTTPEQMAELAPGLIEKAVTGYIPSSDTN